MEGFLYFCGLHLCFYSFYLYTQYDRKFLFQVKKNGSAQNTVIETQHNWARWRLKTTMKCILHTQSQILVSTNRERGKRINFQGEKSIMYIRNALLEVKENYLCNSQYIEPLWYWQLKKITEWMRKVVSVIIGRKNNRRKDDGYLFISMISKDNIS